ncbi:hypothetical protein HB943_14710 [Listeria weihenstephanensis]|uniref:Uncharacterized protein n=1 Tax=Listeria weihenstephanensis TaxID=1006155 RepID=A0A841Z9H6_9LIST|nr:hypothetical protein [Listeria weihenstephanensis]MBC1501850.1 hypothetical protein [Listeria weihenstephanensis]
MAKIQINETEIVQSSTNFQEKQKFTRKQQNISFGKNQLYVNQMIINCQTKIEMQMVAVQELAETAHQDIIVNCKQLVQMDKDVLSQIEMEV